MVLGFFASTRNPRAKRPNGTKRCRKVPSRYWFLTPGTSASTMTTKELPGIFGPSNCNQGTQHNTWSYILARRSTIRECGSTELKPENMMVFFFKQKSAYEI